ncbi:sugar ABC transporter permease [Lachnospiraceae bacterium ZAX-1]
MPKTKTNTKNENTATKTKFLTLGKRQNLTGWIFLAPGALLIIWMSFYPMLRALILSFQTGKGANMSFAEPFFYNYARMFKDKVFLLTMKNTFTYLIIQVPLMLVIALLVATLLNNKDLKCKTLFRVAIFLPCATSLVSSSMIFRTLFANDGFVNTIFMKIGLMSEPVHWLANPGTARFVIILALLWRWTGYNMVLFLAGLQNIDYSIYEAARIDGANVFKTYTKITVPLLRPMILLTAIMSTNGTLQLFDESAVLTNGGPSNMTMTMSHYLYQVSFNNSNFGYASALSFVILILVAILAFIQMKVGDER